MTAFIEMPFLSVLESLYYSVKVTSDTIFVIDELDKYLDARIQKEFYAQSLEQKLEWEEFCSYTKLGYLHSMLRILERDDISAPVIVLFCSNNFDSIFEGVDVTHHRSLYDRFMKVQFKPCDRDEFVDYCLYYNKRLEGTDYYTEITINELEAQTTKDLSITFRALHHLSVEAMYKVDQLLRLVNLYKPIILEVQSKSVTREGVKKITPTTTSSAPTTAALVREKQKSSDENSDENSEDVTVSFNPGLTPANIDSVATDASKRKLWLQVVTSYVSKPSSNLKIPEMLELFAFMASSGYTKIFMEENEKFRTIITDKMKQFIQHVDQPFLLANETTKAFIQEITGHQL